MIGKRNFKTARNVFTFLEQRKLKKFSELFAENGKWFLQYHSRLFPAEMVGQKEIYKSIQNAAADFKIQFLIDEIYPSKIRTKW